jgi:hypothetical protein
LAVLATDLVNHRFQRGCLLDVEKLAPLRKFAGILLGVRQVVEGSGLPEQPDGGRPEDEAVKKTPSDIDHHLVPSPSRNGHAHVCNQIGRNYIIAPCSRTAAIRHDSCAPHCSRATALEV